MDGQPDDAALRAAIEAQERLRGVVPDEVVDAAIAALTQQLAPQATAPQVKRRRLATILFADLSGSTAIGEEIDAEELSDRFDRLWRRIDGIITAHGGVIDKHIGDAVMAVWGADDSSENDPERAILAALEMLRALDDLAATGVLPGTAMRIGVNTGGVVVGPVAGTAEWTVLGDAVNVAARLEAAAPLGAVLIGQDTYRHVRGVFSVEICEPLAVKGKREPLQTYLVEGVRPRAFRLHARTLAGVEVPMIGRDAEIGALRSALDRVIADRHPELSTIVGDAGLGKSRLLFEFEDWLRARSGIVRRFSGRALSDHRDTPYSLLRDLLFDRFEITEDDPPAIARAKLDVGVGDIAGSGLDVEIGILAALIGIPGDDGDDDADPVAAAAALSRLLSAAARQMPVVILLEDLHWSDPASAQMIAHLAERPPAGPVHVVTASRSMTTDTGVELPPGATRLDLAPLASDDIERLVTELLQRVVDLPSALVARIVEAAGGNPFYVEELVRMLVDQSVVVTGADEWTIDVDRLDHLAIPSTLRGVLQARLDRLAADEFAILQRAAVVGETFWPSAIPAAPSGHETGRLLDALLDKGLLQPVPTSDFAGDDELRFSHALLHGVVYETVLLTERPALHGHVAEWMAGRAEGSAATIADHYLAGQRPAEAAEWYGVALTRARARNAAAEGIVAGRAALATEALEPAARSEILDGLIDCLTAAGRYDEAFGLTDDLERLGDELGEPAVVARGRSWRSHLLLHVGRTRDALEEARAACRAADDVGRRCDAAIDARTELGWVMVRLGRVDAAVAAAEDALDRVGPSTEVKQRWRVISLAGVANLAAGRHGAAEDQFLRGLDLARLRSDRRSEAGCLINLSEVSRLQGDLSTAVDLSREALELVRVIHDDDQEALVLSNLGGALVEDGQAEEAVPLLEEAIDGFERHHGSEHTSETHRFLAEAWLELREVERAEAAAATALQLAEASENLDHLGHAWRVTGLVRGRHVGAADHQPDAETCLRRAIEHFDRAEMPRDRAITVIALGRVVAARSAAHGRTLIEAGRAELERLELPALAERLAPTSARDAAGVDR